MNFGSTEEPVAPDMGAQDVEYCDEQENSPEAGSGNLDGLICVGRHVEQSGIPSDQAPGGGALQLWKKNSMARCGVLENGESRCAMKRISVLSLALILLMAGGGCSIDDRSNAQSGSESARVDVPEADSKPAGKFAHKLIETTSDFSFESDAKRRERWPVRMYANGGMGKIVDHNGNIIDQSDSTRFIFGCKVSPDSQQIIIYRGNVDHDLLNLASREVTRLPARPPGEDLLGFNSWDWVADDLLLGISYRVAGEGAEEPIPDRSVFYTYRLSDQGLRRVGVPPLVEKGVVTVQLVDDLGNVRLSSDKGMISRVTGSVAWFALQSTK